MTASLARDEAHLWYVRTDDVGGHAADPALTDEYRRLMSADEAARERRYHRPANRLEHRVARALVRTTLSRYRDVDPRDWIFAAGENGRPEIADPPEPELRFNLSHAPGLVACLVARDRSVGVDVENTGRPTDALEIAERYFAPGEVAELRALPPEERRARFFGIWTLKEAYVKARGLGITVPLDGFAFSLMGGGPAFDAPHDDAHHRWQFTSHAPTGAHVLATAIELTGSPSIDLRIHPTLPLRW
jgi:4'-phosphopantetheinyl transferase